MDARPRFAAALATIALLGAGCGGDDEPARNPLAFFDTPTVIVPAMLKGDRILRGEVRNSTDEELRIEAADIKLYDDRGRRLKAAVTFAPGYLHSLYPPTRGPAQLPDSELERLGR